MKRNSAFIGLGLILAATVVLNQNCSKVASTDSGSTAGVSGAVGGGGGDTNPPYEPPVTPLEDLADLNALVYGPSDSDQKFLKSKLRGYVAPKLSEIFGRWRRFAGNNIYLKTSDVTPDPALAYCYTTFDVKTGIWAAGTAPPKNKPIMPGTHGPCFRSPPFTAASWAYLASPDRLRHGTNAGVYTGFISALPFSTYTNEAVLTSVATDDDEISLVIAVAVDKDNVVHTLSAVRTQGGDGAGVSSKLGLALVYRHGDVTTVIKDVTVGPINPTDGTEGDKQGWNGRSSRVRVERQGNLVKIFASPFVNAGAKAPSFNNTATLTPDISVNVADKKLGLLIFRGAHSYGYATLSQPGAEFSEIKFSTTTSEQFAFDLKTNKVYEQQPNGTYKEVKGKDAIEDLGYPRLVINPETQTSYKLNADKSVTLSDED